MRIIVYPLDETDCPVMNEKMIHRTDLERITCGPSKDDDLLLEQPPDQRFSIYKSSGFDYFLERKNDKIPIEINKIEAESGPIRLKNGDEIRIGSFLLRFEIEFPQVGQNKKVKFLAQLSSLLIVFILILECGVILLLPKQIEKRQIWGVEVRRERTLELVDILRNRCNTLSSSGKDSFYVETIQLIQKELDKMAVYLRQYVNLMGIEQITEFYKDISYFETILNKLDTGTIYPTQITIDVDSHINTLLEKNQINQR